MACSIGRTDKANHQYDLTDFWAASQGGNMSAISYLKAPAYQNGHPAQSDPIDEQDEDNWGLGRMGNQSFDVKAGPINNMFDFSRTGHRAGNLLSNPTTGMQNATGLK